MTTLAFVSLLFVSTFTHANTQRHLEPMLVHGPKGASLELVRPLRSGVRVMDLETLARLAVRIGHHESIPQLDSKDMASVLATVLKNTDVFKFREDARIQAYRFALSPLRIPIPIQNRGWREWLTGGLEDLSVFYRLVEMHRKFGTAEENAAFRAEFSKLAFKIVRDILEARAELSWYPSDQEILEVLTKFRTHVGDASGVAWRDFITEMESRLNPALEPTVTRPILQNERSAGTAGLFVGALGYVGATMAMHTPHVQVSDNTLLLWVGGFFATPFVTAYGANQVAKLWRSRRKMVATDKVDAFIRKCQARLTN